MKNGILISSRKEGAGKSVCWEPCFLLKNYRHSDFDYDAGPGGVQIAEAIREVILEPESYGYGCKRRNSLLACIASRRQHLAERVLPALAQRVLCDGSFCVDFSGLSGIRPRAGCI